MEQWNYHHRILSKVFMKNSKKFEQGRNSKNINTFQSVYISKIAKLNTPPLKSAYSKIAKFCTLKQL